MSMIYLDYAATTPVDDRVAEAMVPFLEGSSFGNPSSLHGAGKVAAAGLEAARKTVAECLNAAPEEVIFTGSGSEADNLAVLGVARALKGHGSNRGNHVITSKVEHAAVANACRQLESEGFELTYLDVDAEGFVNPDDVEKALRPETVLVSIIHGQNEIGTLQPIEEIGKRLRDKKILFHTDAVQTIGKLPMDWAALPVDYLSLSAHKIYGPKGVGALLIRKNSPPPQPLVFGGGQEAGLRSGTQNVAGITGLAAALEIATAELPSESKRLRELQAYLMGQLEQRVPLAVLNGPKDLQKRVPGNVHISINAPGGAIEGDALVLHLDLKGICVSSGSACHSAVIEPSKLILALGKSEGLARATLRFSMGRGTTKTELDETLSALGGVVQRFIKPGAAISLS